MQVTHDELLDAVRAVVNAVDPVGLLKIGCPDDEYEPEVQDFAQRLGLGEQATPQMVRSVLLHWFGRESAFSDRAVQDVAAGLAGIARA